MWPPAMCNMNLRPWGWEPVSVCASMHVCTREHVCVCLYVWESMVIDTCLHPCVCLCDRVYLRVYVFSLNSRSDAPLFFWEWGGGSAFANPGPSITLHPRCPPLAACSLIHSYPVAPGQKLTSSAFFVQPSQDPVLSVKS